MALRRDLAASDAAGGAEHLSLFAVMWALAGVWHLFGNPSGAPMSARAAMTVGIGLVLWRPGAVVPLGVLAVAELATMWGES